MSPGDVEPHFKLYIILTLVPLFDCIINIPSSMESGLNENIIQSLPHNSVIGFLDA